MYCQYDCGRRAETIMHNGKPTTCKACYMRIRYHLNKGTAWMIRRSRQIGSWQTGLDECLGDVAKAKAKSKKKRKAA